MNKEEWVKQLDVLIRDLERSASVLRQLQLEISRAIVREEAKRTKNCQMQK